MNRAYDGVNVSAASAVRRAFLAVAFAAAPSTNEFFDADMPALCSGMSLFEENALPYC